MSRRVLVALFALVLVCGFGAGRLTAGKKPMVTPALWTGQSPEDAAKALLETAETLAEDGSWENIHVGRVYYLSGNKVKGVDIFTRYTGDRAEASDLVRIARVYAEAGEWDEAAPLYEKVLQLKSNDEDWLVEAGAWYNLNGDRQRAEELFARSFEKSPSSLKNALSAAGSYLGLQPRIR